MNAACRSLILSVVATVILSGGASAQTVADIVERWGLSGTWAADCQLPPNPAHWHITYVRRVGGSVDVVRDLGDPARNHTRPMIAARAQPDGKLEVTVDPTQSFTYLLIKAGDGRIRSVSGRLANGTYTVQDGKFLHNGEPTPWQSRCR